MLGTNDLKTRFNRSPQQIATAVVGLARLVEECKGGVNTVYPSPKVLLLAPPPLGTGFHNPEEWAGGPEKSQVLGSVLKEAAAAAKIIGLDIRENLSLPDGFFLNEEKNQRLLISAIRDFRPEIIIASSLDDRHPDHGRAGHLISDASFLSGLRKIETQDAKGQSQEPWRPKYVFHMIQDRYYDPTFVYDITPAFEKKLESVKAYASQFHSIDYKIEEPQTYISTPGFLNSIIGRHQMFGKMIGVEYAEGYISQKMIGIGDFASLIKQDT